MYESLYELPMDDVRKLIAKLMAEKSLSELRTSRMLGLNDAYMNQYLKQNTPKRLPEEVREKLAILLHVNENDLRPNTQQNKKSTLNMKNNIGTVSDIQFGPDMIPILGSANGSSEAFVLNFDEPIGEISRHPGQKNMNGAFAIEVRGLSMTPRYKAGWIVYPIANKYPRPDQGCIIEMKNDGEAFLKVFIRETEKEIICMQYNPEKEWRRLKSEIKALHAISGTTE